MIKRLVIGKYETQNMKNFNEENKPQIEDF